MQPTSILKATAFLATVAVCAPVASAQSIADFYKATTVNLMIPTPSGSGYDFEARFVGRHITKHIPGQPKLVPQNMPGAGGLRVTNAIYNTAPQDGSNLAMVMNSTAMMQTIDGQGVQYDVTEMHWIGSVSPAVDTMGIWHTQNVKTVEDAKTKTVISAATGKGANSYFVPSAMNELLGTKFKIVTGYQGAPDMNLAMERGEAGARGNSWSSWVTTKPDWLADKKLYIIAYAGPKPKDMFPGVPALVDLVKSEEDKLVMQIVFSGSDFGRPFVMGPKVPADRVAAIREAFAKTMKDPEFLAEAEKLKVDIDPVTGAYMQDLASKLVSSPKSAANRAKALVE